MKRKLRLMVNQEEVLKDIVEASSFLEKLRGYMFQSFPLSQGILFRNCNSLHSYFMHFDIDVYFLDQENRLIQYERGFTKNRTIYVKKATHVLETTRDAIDCSKIEVGQLFDFETA